MFSFNKSTENKDQHVRVLEERITALEQQNASIMREMHNMTFHYFQQLERLDRRITDFGDALPPMMAANIVRIKDEVVAETQTRIDGFKQQIKNEIAEEIRPKSLEEQAETNPNKALIPCVYYTRNGFFPYDFEYYTSLDVNANDKTQLHRKDRLRNIIIGNGWKYMESQYKDSQRNKAPTNIQVERTHEQSLERILQGGYAELIEKMRQCTHYLIVDNVALFKNIRKIDLADLVDKDEKQIIPKTMIDIDGNVICSSPMWGGKIEYSRVEKLDKVFAKYGVELLYEGKPIRFST
jgi:hypothetical protein